MGTVRILPIKRESQGRIGMQPFSQLPLLLLVVVNFSAGSNEVAQRIIYSTPTAPLPIGPYNQAVQLNNVVYVSGQIGLNPITGQLVEGVVDQARQALSNVGELLRLAHSDF